MSATPQQGFVAVECLRGGEVTPFGVVAYTTQEADGVDVVFFTEGVVDIDNCHHFSYGETLEVAPQVAMGATQGIFELLATCERDEVEAVREELARTGRLTATDDSVVVLTYRGVVLSARRAVEIIDSCESIAAVTSSLGATGHGEHLGEDNFEDDDDFHGLICGCGQRMHASDVECHDCWRAREYPEATS